MMMGVGIDGALSQPDDSNSSGLQRTGERGANALGSPISRVTIVPSRCAGSRRRNFGRLTREVAAQVVIVEPA
jgi:hypothetical protein